jgi:peroxiredoxin
VVIILIILHVLVWAFAIALACLVYGMLRYQGLLSWRLDQFVLMGPSIAGRNGLEKNTSAPDFRLPSTEGGEVGLRDFAGAPLLLVFVSDSCSPCRHLIPILNGVQSRRGIRVAAILNTSLPAASKWATDARVQFPVLVQEGLSLSRRYKAYATPFAYLIGSGGSIVASGLVSEPGQLEFVLDGISGFGINGRCEVHRLSRAGATAQTV